MFYLGHLFFKPCYLILICKSCFIPRSRPTYKNVDNYFVVSEIVKVNNLSAHDRV